MRSCRDCRNCSARHRRPDRRRRSETVPPAGHARSAHRQRSASVLRRRGRGNDHERRSRNENQHTCHDELRHRDTVRASVGRHICVGELGRRRPGMSSRRSAPGVGDRSSTPIDAEPVETCPQVWPSVSARRRHEQAFRAALRARRPHGEGNLTNQQILTLVRQHRPSTNTTANGSKRETRRSIEKLRKAQREEEKASQHGRRRRQRRPGGVRTARRRRQHRTGGVRGERGGANETTLQRHNRRVPAHRRRQLATADRTRGRQAPVHQAWGKWIVYRDGKSIINMQHDVTETAKQVAQSMFDLLSQKIDSDDRKRLFKEALRSKSSAAIGAMIHLARGTRVRQIMRTSTPTRTY